MQLESVVEFTSSLLDDARKKLKIPSKDIRFDVIDVGEFGQGTLFICPFCNYSSRKNRRGSAKIFGTWFKCFHCNERRRCIDGN